MKVMLIVIFAFAMIVQTVHSQAVMDQKTNCSDPTVPKSYCYDGPQLDVLGQVKSCAQNGSIALTFDDGPSANTGAILDILKQYGMKATFFIIGRNIKNYPNDFQRIYNEGHQIACHTYHHMWLLNVTAQYVQSEITLWENEVAPYNMTLQKYFRAPHGAMDSVSYQAVVSMGYKVIHWGFLDGDTNNGTTSQDVINLYYEHFGGTTGTGVIPSQLSIITQQHDKENSTTGAFPTVAAYLSSTFGSQGANFTRIDDCLSPCDAFQSYTDCQTNLYPSPPPPSPLANSPPMSSPPISTSPSGSPPSSSPSVMPPPSSKSGSPPQNTPTNNATMITFTFSMILICLINIIM